MKSVNKSKTKETTTVAHSGNSQFVHLAGEGPETQSSQNSETRDDQRDPDQSFAQQEATPTILSHDLGKEGMPDQNNRS